VASRATGHLQVRGTRGRRTYYALIRERDGTRRKRRLGPAHIKDTGRRTARGAVVWRAADGPKPSPEHLTPAEAEATLRELLGESDERAAPNGRRPRRRRGAGHTFGEACHAWLEYIEHDRQRARSTVRDYRNTVRHHLLPGMGTDRPVADIDTAAIEELRRRLLVSGLSRRTVQKVMVLLHGILKRAKRLGWIGANPAENAERVSVTRSGEFNVLSPAEVEAVARAAASEQDSTIFAFAAFTGLRMGELRGLCWSDVDFAHQVVHVRRSYAHGAFGPPKSGRVRSVPLTDQAAARIEGLSRRERWTGPDDLVFINDVGNPFDDVRLRRRFYTALEVAGLGRLRRKPDPIVFHDLRHTFGTLAVQAFPLSDVKAMLGHERIETTMIYIHHIPQRDAANRLTALLRHEEAGVSHAAIGAERGVSSDGNLR